MTPPPAPKQKFWALGPKTTFALIAGAIVLVAGAIAAVMIASKAQGANIDVTTQSCTFQGETLPSVTVEFTVANSGSRPARIEIDWVFRDSSGARIDTDTTRLTVPAGETVRSSETTLLPVAVSSGTCGYRVS